MANAIERGRRDGSMHVGPWQAEYPRFLAFIKRHVALAEKTITTAGGLTLHLYAGEFCLSERAIADALDVDRQRVRTFFAWCRRKGLLSKSHRPLNLYKCPLIRRVHPSILRSIMAEIDRSTRACGEPNPEGSGLSSRSNVKGQNVTTAALGGSDPSRSRLEKQAIRSGYGRAALSEFADVGERRRWRPLVLSAVKRFGRHGRPAEIAAISRHAAAAGPRWHGATLAWLVRRRLDDCARHGHEVLNLPEWLDLHPVFQRAQGDTPKNFFSSSDNISYVTPRQLSLAS